MRLEKIDLLRGISIIGMIFFHANYMLESLFQRDIIPLPDIFWWFLGPGVAFIFIFLSGFSFFLSSEEKSLVQVFRKSLRRSIFLALWAFSITAVTYTFIPEQRISWGIIHFFALSAAILPLFSFAGRYTIFFWIFIVFIGHTFGDVRVGTDFFIPWGWIPVWYFSADYYPIFPWFWYMLIGHGAAYWTKYFSLLSLLRGPHVRSISPILTIGRHAFFIYMLHVPILYLILWGLFR